MMVRLLAFALHADDSLEFGRGLSTEDEPDLWRRDLTGAIERWIDVGLPDEWRGVDSGGDMRTKGDVDAAMSAPMPGSGQRFIVGYTSPL